MAKWGGCGLAFKEGGSAFGGGYGFVGVWIGGKGRLSNSNRTQIVEETHWRRGWVWGWSVVGWWLVAARLMTLSKKEKKS